MELLLIGWSLAIAITTMCLGVVVFVVALTIDFIKGLK